MRHLDISCHEQTIHRIFRCGDMEITQADLRIGDCVTELMKNEKNQEREKEINIFYAIDIKEECGRESRKICKNLDVTISEPNLNSIQHETRDVQSESYDSFDTELIDDISTDQSTKEYSQTYSISTVVIPSDILEELSISIKKENTDTINSQKSNIFSREEINFVNERHNAKNRRIRCVTRHEYRERLRKKAECMREKRKKLYEQESEEERTERLAKEAAKRREMRMYYETPEQRRKRLDAEAARKREYRMYNETPDERRKRLDREAERRRVKRLTMYASETPEQRRERLNRESAKRREARLNQYAKETEDQRQERLRKDALRAREMRFTRSAIETEEERRQRLVKDALRKRELRMHGGTSMSNFTELQTVRNFEELNNVQMKDDPDCQLGGHYLSNWMMWFQNTLAQPVNSDEHDDNHQQSEV